MITCNCKCCGKDMLFFFKREKDELEKNNKLLCVDCNKDTKFFVCIQCGKIFYTKTKQKICRSCIAKEFSSKDEYKKKQSVLSKKRWRNLTP